MGGDGVITRPRSHARASRVATALAALAASAWLTAAQDPPTGRATVRGQAVVFAPARGMWDPATHRVSVIFPATALAPDIEAAARRSGAWPISVPGPAVLVELDYAATSTSGLQTEITACRVRFLGFRAPLELKGRASECHVASTGGLLRTGGGLAGLLEGSGPDYAFRLPFPIAFLEVPAATTRAADELRAPAAPPTAAAPVSYDYRVAVATGESPRVVDVEASLERNVNRLAHAGYEVAAFLEGTPSVLDELLGRRPGGDFVNDDRGQAFVVMRRPAGAATRREYKLIHQRYATFGFDKVVAPLNAGGYVLTAFAHDGDMFRAAFERRASGPPVEYQVFVNRGRRSWMDQVRADAAVLGRLRRVVPMGLDFAMVELGAEASPPGALEWTSAPTHRSTTIEDTLKAKAPAGFRVQLVRLRRSELDVLLVRPAGPADATHTYDVDDGPWGGPCSNGRIVGAAGHTDGDVYCVAEDPRGGIANRGFDTVLRVPKGGTAVVFDETPSCVDRARLLSPRGARARMAAAAQLERLLNRKVERGYVLERVLVVRDESGETRLVGFASNARHEIPPGPPADGAVVRLEPDVDGYLDDATRQRQRELSEKFAREVGTSDVWLDVEPAGQRSVVLSGCVSTRAEKDRVERAARILLSYPPYTSHRLRSTVLVDFFK